MSHETISGLLLILLIFDVALMAQAPIGRAAMTVQAAYSFSASTNPPSTEWSKTYGGTDDERAYTLVQTSDGGYTMIGTTTSSPGSGTYGSWLVKTDASGNMQWNKTYRRTGDDELVRLIETTDGGYALVGETAGTSGYYYDFHDAWLVKTDAFGNMQWNKTYGGTGDDEAFALVQTSDGGYVLAGATDSFGAGDKDAWLIKTDASGNMQWNKTYGGTSSDLGLALVQTDGGYVIAGYTDSFGAGDKDAWLVKTDAFGNMQWNKTYGGTGDDEAGPLVKTADGGYALVGRTSSFGGWDAWLVKTDASGNMQWNSTFGKSTFVNGSDCSGSCLVQTSDGGYALVGAIYSPPGGGIYDAWLVKTDPFGNILWDKTYGGTGDDQFSCLAQTSDGGYALAGATDSFGAGDRDFWLVRTAPTICDVVFTESGLPSGASWSVDVNGETQSTSGSTITFQEAEGQYSFNVTCSNTLYKASPASRGIVAVAGSTDIAITWLEQTSPVTIKEVGLPGSTSWSVTYGCITQISNTDETVYFFPTNGGTYSFSASSPGYIAQPASFIANVSGTPTDVVFIPTGNTVDFTSWNPFEDSYSTRTSVIDWSAVGNCYGLSSTALLYFMHYAFGDAVYPLFPSQYPQTTSSTSDLDLGSSATLNNASLAVMFHEVYDPWSCGFGLPSVSDVNKADQYANLLGNLTEGQPVVLALGDATGWHHAVVAWEAGTLKNGSYAISVYDPNHPQSTQVAIYDADSGTFSYAASGPYDSFFVTQTTEIRTSWLTLFPYEVEYALSLLRDNWLPISVTDYVIVLADKMVKVSSNGLTDYFTVAGDSTSFVRGIPGSSGMEEGNIQVYAIPESTSYPTVSDPGSTQSTILVTRIGNESGQLVSYGYLLNATATQGPLDYTLIPSGSGLSISAGNTPVNASVLFCYANLQNCSFFQESNIVLGAMDTANFTVTDWQKLNNTNAPPVTVTIHTVPEFPTMIIIGPLMIISLLAAITWSCKGRRIQRLHFTRALNSV